MTGLVVTTFDWVPEFPRGYVRDIRLRWVLEEVGLAYEVASVPFSDRGPEHFACQPFGQVPWLTDGSLTIFESGAGVQYLAEKSGKLLPKDPSARAQARSWIFAALNSVEAASLPWLVLKFAGGDPNAKEFEAVDGFLTSRLTHLETVLSDRHWLAGEFSVADILMADVLRVPDRFDRLEDHPACKAYLARATDRPAFIKARADQVAHFERADEHRSAETA